jgi:hypothetical protein
LSITGAIYADTVHRDRQSDVYGKLEQITSASLKMSAETARELGEARAEAQRVFYDLRTQADHTRACIETIATSQRDMKTVLDKLERQSATAETSTHILKSLQFPRMHDRRSLIPESHPQTFSWIFESSMSPFKDWLREHSGAFWVSGKAGSGKSTLMKYITQSSETANVLRDWAEGRELFTASFYFWITGSRMQNNQEGLLQSILYEILRQEPTLIPTVLRTRWERDEYFHCNPDPWTLSELYDALDATIHEKPKACFCFFVDGLDEYVGDAGQQGEFAERIQRLASSPSVKLCVASRPWIAFDNVFGKDEQRMLILEDLTRDDMDAYVRGMLVENIRFTELLKRDPAASGLVREIRDKAHGVFLWVTLVVKSLLSGLTQHDDLEELKRRLQTLPSDLREFFARMLDSIDDEYKLYASRILFLALHATPLPLMSFFWVQVEAKEPDYAIRAAIEELECPPTRIKTARMYLNKWSKDLLAVYDVADGSNDSGDMSGFKIDFLHRTVGDFLKEPDVHDQLRKQSGPGFDPDQSICRLLLAETKTSRVSEDPTACLESFQSTACRMIYHAKRHEMQHCHALTPLLWNFDKAITTRLERAHGASSVHWTASIRESHVAKIVAHRENALNKSSNFLAYAVANDLLEFVREALNECPFLLQKPGRPLLDFASYPTFPEYDLTDDARDTTYLELMVKLLLEFGSVPDQHAKVIGSMTVWQMFLLDSYNHQSPTRPGAWDVARLLLEHNANRQAEVPVDKIVSDIVLKRNPFRDGDLTFKRDTIQFASVKDCLSCIKQAEVVNAFFARVPASKVGLSWGILPALRSWFL